MCTNSGFKLFGHSYEAMVDRIFQGGIIILYRYIQLLDFVYDLKVDGYYDGSNLNRYYIFV